MKTIAEQIAAFEARRVTIAKSMEDIMSAAADEGSTLDAAQKQEYDGHAADIVEIDEHIGRLKSMEKVLVQRAVATIVSGGDPEGASASRGGGVRAQVGAANVPKGIAFTRYAIAMMRGKGDLGRAVHLAKNEASWHNTPEVAQVLEAQYRGGDLETIMRSAVAAGTTSDGAWAGPLVQYNIMAGEFIELLRPQTIIGKFGANGVPPLRKVPFNIKVPRQTSGSTVQWVGEGKPKPISKLAFDNVTLQWAKAAGIVVLTDELVRFSNPSAESLVQGDLIDAIVQFLDQQFTDPDIAAVANVSPASITNGVTPVFASGTTADDFRSDVLALKQKMAAAKISSAGGVWLMPETQADALGMMVNALGQPEFPGIDANGGKLLGAPVLVSQNDGLTDGDSPTGARIVFVKASEIMLADDGDVLLDASREASLQMDSAPDDPVSASTVMVSLWQHNMVGLRAERWINWQSRRNTGPVQWITNCNYGS